MVVAAFGVDGLSNILKFVPDGITRGEIKEHLGESKDYEKLLRFIDDDPTVTPDAKGTISFARRNTNMNAVDGGNRKSRRSKTRYSKTRKNKRRYSKTRKNKRR